MNMKNKQSHVSIVELETDSEDPACFTNSETIKIHFHTYGIVIYDIGSTFFSSHFYVSFNFSCAHVSIVHYPLGYSRNKWKNRCLTDVWIGKTRLQNRFLFLDFENFISRNSSGIKPAGTRILRVETMA